MLKTRLILPLAALAVIALPFQAVAGEANITRVTAKETSANIWSFSVSVRHKDKGWKHYADNWEVLSPEGDILATRVLAHPHVNEQPFTRSLSGVKIPEGVSEVIIRAHDSVHGYGGKRMRVNLTTGKASRDKTPLSERPDAQDGAERIKATN